MYHIFVKRTELSKLEQFITLIATSFEHVLTIKILGLAMSHALLGNYLIRQESPISKAVINFGETKGEEMK